MQIAMGILLIIFIGFIVAMFGLFVWGFYKLIKDD